jgi:hypothetical protein
MRLFLLSLLYLVGIGFAYGQKIDYDIPKGYENEVSKQDYRKIVDIAVPIIAKRYAVDFVKEGTVRLKKNQDMQALNLHNLIGKCVAVGDKAQWAVVIQEHLSNLFSSIDEQKKINPGDFTSVEKYLSLRIYDQATINQRGGAQKLVTHTDLEGTYTLLMLDLPGAFTPVPREMFDLWKKDAAEVFALAQAHVNGQPVEKITKTFDFSGTPVEISFLGNEDYAASYALGLLANSPELVGEWGTALAIPNKGLVNMCKISKDKPLDFVKFIQYTKPLIEKSYRTHAQPVSDQYFWYYQGQFTKITVVTDATGAVNVISPMGLTKLMTEK